LKLLEEEEARVREITQKGKNEEKRLNPSSHNGYHRPTMQRN
jgi:hypothetical protein